MKKLMIITTVVVMMCAFAFSAMASTQLPAASEGFAFHCNDIEGSNGKTYIEGKDKDFGKFDKKLVGKVSDLEAGLIKLAPVETDLTGKTWIPVENLGVCTTCGRPDWVSYSNKSGVPDGKNIQLQHPGSSRRWITVAVTYFIDIFKCEFTCNIADCDFAIECTEDCECGDMCGIDCDCEAVDHTCPAAGCAACDCEFSDSKVIVNEKHLIKIADGYFFWHRAPRTWEGGAYDSGPRFIHERLYNSKTYNVYYVGAGDCVCECECDGVQCECMKEVTEKCCYQLDDGTWICDNCGENPCSDSLNVGCTHNCNKGCEHALVCSVCYDAAGDNKDPVLEKGSHPGCHNEVGGKNTFFCLNCDYKETNWNNGKNPAPVPYCKCPVCQDWYLDQ